MSETRDEATGQFTPESEQLFGQAAEEQAAGYVPLPDEPDAGAEELPAREAAEKLAALSSSRDIKTYTGVADLDNNVTLTLDQAAKVVTDDRNADLVQAEIDGTKKLQKEVDELRGVDPEAKAAEPGKEAATEAPPVKDGELDPEIEKALNNPKIKEAIAAQISEAETVRQTYSKAVDVANDFARASFVEHFPEIAGLPLEQWVDGLTAMAHREPDRFNKAMGTLNRVVQLQNAQQHQQQQRAAVERQQFEVYSKEQNAIFAANTKSIPTKEMRAIEAEVPKMLAEYGADARQFLEAIGTSTTFPRAAAERIMVDAVKYRMLKSVTLPKPGARPLPSVQRPGSSTPRTPGGDLSALDRKFSASGDIKDAVKLYVARRAGR
jgi:hypothetical protein